MKKHTPFYQLGTIREQITLNNSNHTVIQLPISDADCLILIDQSKFRYQGKSYKLIRYTEKAGIIHIIGLPDDASEKINKPFLKKKAQPVKKDPTLARKRIA
ncbi:MAG: hypothetical protein ACKVTZ_02120 [Bacteroidia bacterium]